jgi:hypothetical protein
MPPSSLGKWNASGDIEGSPPALAVVFLFAVSHAFREVASMLATLSGYFMVAFIVALMQ